MPRAEAGELARSVWPEIPKAALVLVPVGSTEQHGPHLPLGTDSVIAETVARRTARQLTHEHVLLAPCITYGASGEHAGFPGTVSIGHEALHVLLVETVRSLSLWAGRVVFVKLMAHGVRAVSPSGVLGDPAGATAEEGRALLRAMVSAAVRLITEGDVDARGRLAGAGDTPRPAGRRTAARS
ncbi:creatininase family protein [Streptomyces sp. NPDC002088]|uniref:creatininase family protein n=1 Tax=Streptomyces sp. NPDC002088 TaxID=3154665 RepID=UPI00332DC675